MLEVKPPVVTVVENCSGLLSLLGFLLSLVVGADLMWPVGRTEPNMHNL